MAGFTTHGLDPFETVGLGVGGHLLRRRAPDYLRRRERQDVAATLRGSPAADCAQSHRTVDRPRGRY